MGPRGGRDRRPTPAEVKRRQNLATRYGLTDAQISALRDAQGGLCGICRRPMRRECVDHAHDSGRVRGLLCHGCNIKLPAVEDVAFRNAAALYLEGAAK